MISLRERMKPDGDLAMEFTRHDYSIDTHTLWLDTRQQHDENDAAYGELDVMNDGKMVDTVYTPKKGYPYPASPPPP